MFVAKQSRHAVGKRAVRLIDEVDRARRGGNRCNAGADAPL
jgi:hypothetical protein